LDPNPPRRKDCEAIFKPSIGARSAITGWAAGAIPVVSIADEAGSVVTGSSVAAADCARNALSGKPVPGAVIATASFSAPLGSGSIIQATAPASKMADNSANFVLTPPSDHLPSLIAHPLDCSGESLAPRLRTKKAARRITARLEGSTGR
jgi:hypothetical protein